jgi:hypothetical protein
VRPGSGPTRPLTPGRSGLAEAAATRRSHSPGAPVAAPSHRLGCVGLAGEVLGQRRRRPRPAPLALQLVARFRVEAAGDDVARMPRLLVVGVLEVVHLATSPICLGCAFQAAAAEFHEASDAGHAAALAHKEEVRARLRQLAADAGAADPGALGDALLLLMDGAFAAARMYGLDNPAAGVGAAARSLIHMSVVHPPQRRGRR